MYYICEYITKTVILKLANLDNDLVETMQRYSVGMNYSSKIVFDNGKPMSVNSLQSEFTHTFVKHWN